MKKLRLPISVLTVLTGSVVMWVDSARTRDTAPREIESGASTHFSAAESFSAGDPGTVPASESFSTPALQTTREDPLREFVDSVSQGDAATIRGVLERMSDKVEYAGRFMAILDAKASTEDMRRSAAEALIRIGTSDSVAFVLDQVLLAEHEGQTELARTLLSSLEALQSAEGTQPLFDLLLGRNRSLENRDSLPGEFRNAIRKALRNHPEWESVAELAMGSYLEAESVGDDEARTELLAGIAQPTMLSKLAVRSFKAGGQDNALELLDHIADLDGQQVVSAMINAGSAEPGLLDATAERLYSWSRTHPEHANAGVYLGYMNDHSRQPRARIIAAYGLAGVADEAEAIHSFSKAIAEEADLDARQNWMALMSYLDAERRLKNNL